MLAAGHTAKAGRSENLKMGIAHRETNFTYTYVESCLTISIFKTRELLPAQGLQRGLTHLCGMQGRERDHHLVVDAGAVIVLPTIFVQCIHILL